jgi:predicted ATPase
LRKRSSPASCDRPRRAQPDRDQRRERHEHVVQALETHFPDTVMAQPDLRAHHCAEASWFDQAVSYQLKAGRQALARSAMAEAIAQLTKGLELLAPLPEDASRQRRGRDLRIHLGQSFAVAKGYALSGVGETYARATA